MQRRKFSRRFKIEAVKLLPTPDLGDAHAGVNFLPAIECWLRDPILRSITSIVVHSQPAAAQRQSAPLKTASASSSSLREFQNARKNCPQHGPV